MPLPQQKRKMLGEMLIAEGLISREQLERALSEQKLHGGRIGTIFRSMGFVTEEDIIKVLGKQMGIQPVTLSSIIIDPDVVKIIPETMARRHQVIPVFKKDRILTLAMVDPLNVFAIDDLRRATGMEIQPVVSSESEVMKAIDRFYSATSTMEEAAKEADIQGYGVMPEEQVIDLQRIGDDTPMIKLVNTMIAQAVREGASDIHIEPDAEVLRIRYRVDGMLREVMTPPRNLQAGVVSRIKIMADLDIAEKRVPQDGRIQMKVGEKDVDIRLSTLPTIFGEKLVMRLLDKGSILLGLEEMGFSADNLKKFEKMIRRPYGLLLVTGPTGSGKTTTLYAALNRINSIEKNVITIEDPVEYQLKYINQVQVNSKVGITFANGLRSILRQDPNVIMVGEIRDTETVSIAIQAALTGHLVFSTLHTNDAAGAMARLLDMGAEPFLVASSLIGVMAQRLVRKVCAHCKGPFTPTPDLVKSLNLEKLLDGRKEIHLVKGSGCQQCRNTGYLGRAGIYELLPVDEAIRNLIVAKASSGTIRNQAVQSGFVGLRLQGLAAAVRGLTTLEEVLRVTQEIEA
ncbi:MAG TPA: type II secretion system ATPase GspE [Nitrospiria bacterium]|nr:type II secretion system ATPase GspE [Nitrospiria bacterium]